MPRLLLVATHATDDPTKATLPLVTAIGAKTGGIDCTLAFVGEGAALIRDVVANSVHGVGFPAFKELMSQVVDAKVPIYV